MAQKKFDRAESELMQLAEDAARAAYQADRMVQLQEAINRVNEAKGEEEYFQDVIHYFNTKLAFFNAIE